MQACSVEGCANPARRKYCSDLCADRERQRRLRDRERDELDRVDVTVVVTSTAASRPAIVNDGYQPGEIWGVSTIAIAVIEFRDASRRGRRRRS